MELLVTIYKFLIKKGLFFPPPFTVSSFHSLSISTEEEKNPMF